MFGLAGVLIANGLNRVAANLIGVLAPLAVVVLAVVWLRNDAYQEGKRDTDARWEEALARQAHEADIIAEVVGDDAVVRADEWAEQVKKEKEDLDEAEAAGTDPFDVLFGSE